MTLSDFVGRLEGVKKDGNGFAARCPAHEDKRQSLSVKAGEKGIVLKCHAGCDAADVVKSVGLAMKDLFPAKEAGMRNSEFRIQKGNRQDAKTVKTPAPKSSQREDPTAGGAERPQIVAEYDYRDEAGALLFQVVRFDPKDFRQRAPTAGVLGGWSWKTSGVRKVLFRLSELLEGPADEADPLFIVEGEKDVLALVNAGFVATCNAGGAGKWQPDYAVSVKAWRRIIIVADKDEPGRKHAQAVAAALAEAGRTVKVIEVPSPSGQPLKDVADFLAAGGDVQSLVDLAEAAPAMAAAPPVMVPAVASPAALPDLPPCVFDTCRQRFYIPGGHDKEWIPVNDSRVNTYFKSRGFSEFVKDAFGVSVLESALQKVVIEKNVGFAGQIAGHWPGPVTVAGQRMLITRGPQLLGPKAGDWGTLRGLLESLLCHGEHGAEQWVLFCGWVQAAVESLRLRTFRPGLVLVLCGPPGSGKSQLQGLLTLLLGGRSANPYAFLTGRTDFNLDLIGAEHLTIDDDASERDFKSRQGLGQRLKKLAVGDTVTLHGKGRDALTVKAFSRVSICINDDPQDLMVLPPMESSVREKFLILQVKPATFPEMEGAEDFARFKAKLAGELPAFLHWLATSFQVPEKLRSARYGVVNWQHPALMLDLEALHPWQRLLELVDWCRPWGEVSDTWEGTTADLEEVLRETGGRRCEGVLRGPQGTGMDLNSAMQRLPYRISKRSSMGHTIWILRKGGRE